MKIQRERNRRKREERIRFFKPSKPDDLNPNYPELGCNDQMAFIMSGCKERWIFGGNRSGKTEITIADAIWFATGEHPVWSKRWQPPVYIRIISTSWENGVEKIIIPKFKEMVKRSDLLGGSWTSAYSAQRHTLTFKNGSEIDFMTSEQDVDKHYGVKRHAVYLDEHHPMEYYTQSLMRLADYDGFLVGAMTPELGVTWEADHVNNVEEGQSINHWFFLSMKNPFISKEAIEQLKYQIKDPVLLAAKLKGEFVPLTGRVVPQWNRAVSVVPDRKLHPDAVRVFMIDCHLKAPFAAMWLAWEPDPVFESRLIVYRTAKKKMTIDEWKSFIRKESAGEKIEFWYGDETESEEAGTNNYQSKGFLSQFREGPVVIPIQQVKKGRGSYYAGIMKLRNWFAVDPVSNTTRIQIFESCSYAPEFIDGKPAFCLPDELDRFRFKKETKADEENLREHVAKVDDHFIDDVRYIANMGPFVAPSKSQSLGFKPYGN